MSNEELEQDDLEMASEEEAEALEDPVEEEDDDEGEGDGAIDAAERVTPTKKAKAEETEDLPTPEAKQRERDELARAMEEFLARGGQVQEIEPNVVADPPKKPDGKYGSRPI